MQDFEGFVAVRSQALSRAARLLCGGDKSDAEDILQDVLKTMYGKWRRTSSSPGSVRAPRRPTQPQSRVSP